MCRHLSLLSVISADLKAIGVMFMLYLFLFSWFDPEEEITEKRALVWQVLHLPMHLVILLLLSAMVVSGALPSAWTVAPN